MEIRYRGHHSESLRRRFVVVRQEVNGDKIDTYNLQPYWASNNIFNDNFSWGYKSHGLLNLSTSILYDYTKDEKISSSQSKKFVKRVLTYIDEKEWEITSKEIEDFFVGKKSKKIAEKKRRDRILLKEIDKKSRRRLPTKPIKLTLDKWESISIFEDAAPHQFSEETDPMMRYGISLGDEILWMTDDYTVEEIASKCRKTAKWLARYANWIETIIQEGNRCHIKRKRRRNGKVTSS